MAPIKRTRRVQDDIEDEEIVDVQEARSSLLHSSSRKKARLSIEDPRESRRLESTVPPSESEDESDDEVMNGPPQTQYELMRDDGFRHLAHPEWDDQQATQKLKNRPTRVGDNAVAESGIIESITCYNFMCHERLHVELGPLINFVVGENGSGKSAVLTALTLCLGGKASDTNRGGSLKSFVREGQEHGSLVVKIKNAGSDAYQPDIYGDSIIVERHFSKTGSSGFRIKSIEGRMISNKKQEIDEISEWFALQISNPLTVLSQDNARQFLNSATPAQKYKYFVSGVQLEQLDNDYKLSQDTLDRTLILREELNGRIGHIKKDMEDAKRLSDVAQKNGSLRDKGLLYRNQLVWQQVVEKEQALESAEAAIVETDQRIGQAQAECEEASAALATVEEKLERTQAVLAEVEEGGEAYDEKVAAAEAVYRKFKDEVIDLQRQERDAHGRLQALTKDIGACEEKIEQEEQRLHESAGPARAEKEQEQAEANSREQELAQQLEQHRDETSEFKTSVENADDALKKVRRFKDLKRKEVLTAENQVRDLEKGTGSPYDGFSRDITNIVKAIDSDKGFDQKPLGPIGAFVKLKKPEWSKLIDKTIGEGLNAFVVRSKRDQTRLSGLIRRLNVQRPPQIYIAYGGSLDTRSQEPDPQFDTILRVLEFTNDTIRTQLIINNQIEKIILIKNRKEAEDVMLDGGPPRNVSACMCFHDGSHKRGHGLRITNRGGNLSSSPVAPNDSVSRMQTDSGQEIAIQKQLVNQLGREMRELIAEERTAMQAFQRNTKSLEAHLKSIKELEGAHRRAQADIQRVSEELDAFEGVDDRLHALREELQGKRSEEVHLGDQYGHMRLLKRDLNTQSKDSKDNLEAMRREVDDFKARVNKGQEKVKNQESMRRIAVSTKNDAFEKIDMAKVQKQRAEEERERAAATVEEFFGQATEVVPERVFIPAGETYEQIEKKYQKVREQLAIRERRLGASDELIHTRFQEADARYKDVLQQTKDVDGLIASLKLAITHRLNLWRQFQRQISARVRVSFAMLLSERGFRGKIDLDHKHHELKMQIEPDEHQKRSAGRSTKTLSGGEKSFSSICMLLSVWEAIGSPIRCLDEFDVFMDNINRAISTNMLIDTARRSVSRQYILITPNAIEGRAHVDKDVKIIRLTDPRQRTLI